MSIQWNWSWVSAREDTNKASDTIDQSGGTLYPYRVATRGQLDSAQLKNSTDSLITNSNAQWRLWRSYIRPIIDSLPAGPRDQRWRPGVGLPEKIDALNFGVQGTTLLVFNDADSVKASGRYWHSTDERPKTIAEAFEDLWDAVNDIEVSSTSSSASVDLEDLWLAVGHHYRNASLASASTSLDARVSQVESNQNQLSDDLYGASEGFGTYDFGVPLAHSLAKNIDYILKLHGVAGGWQNDPSAINHSAVVAAAHVHPYTEISPMPSVSLTQGRVAPYSTLYNDILRLRFEIAQTRGSANWYSDVTDPVDSAAATLNKHVNHTGSGSISSSNPHAIGVADIGADTYFSNLARYTGMSDYTSGVEMPTYSSVNYVTQGASLETAIGELDSAVNSLLGTVCFRIDYSYDRSHLSETARAQTPITITHNMGRKPLVQVQDISPEEQDYFGQYVSQSTEANVVHLDTNTMEIWCAAAAIEIIAIF